MQRNYSIGGNIKTNKFKLMNRDLQNMAPFYLGINSISVPLSSVGFMGLNGAKYLEHVPSQTFM